MHILEKESVEKSCSNKLEAISLVLPGCWLLISVWKWTSWFRVLGPIVHFILCIHCGRNSMILSKNYDKLDALLKVSRFQKNCWSETSPKKWTNKFVFITMTNSFVCFLREFEGTKKSFRNYLNFSGITKIALRIFLDFFGQSR